MIVHQLLFGAGPVDAVTAQARAYRRLFEGWGWGGADHAISIAPGVERSIRPLRSLHADPGDLLLFHYTASSPRLLDLLELPNPKALVSHNVTPAHWFWRYSPPIAIQCAVARARLPEYAQSVDLAIGVSAYNARELADAGARATAVIPVLVDADGLGPPGPEPPPGPPTVLFVGRLSPHKRQDEVIRVFALLRRHRLPEARLNLIGVPMSPAFREALQGLADRLAPGAVTIETGLPDAALRDRYRAAHAFLCLSEHEGFCIPLLEAFHFSVPVIARPTGGIPEVAGDAALLTPPGADRGTLAELVALAIEDAELRAELRRRGEQRLREFAPERTAATLRAALESVAPGKPEPPGGR